MTQDESPPVPPTPPSSRPAVAKGWVLAALAILLLFIGQQGSSLWGEWHRLQDERSRARQSAVIGYPNISPRDSYARRPDDWFHDEGDFSCLWGGWDSR